MIHMIRTRIGTDERGTSLILALAFLALIGMGMATLLAFADTGIRATVALRSRRDAIYSVDGAAQAAINGVRQSTTLGVSETTICPPVVGINGVVPTVTCAGQAGGGGSSGANTAANTPLNGILTLGTSMTATDGATFASSNNLLIQGSLSSNSTIVDLNGELDVSGNVTAQSQNGASGCSGGGGQPKLVGGVGSMSCNATALAQDPGLTDTTYALPISSVPSAGTIPACTSGVATFSPGTYTDPSKLSTCAKNLFAPGVYYFNFPNTSSAWNINYVIGGTARTNNTDCDQTKPGVLFVFGGKSSVVIGDGATFIVCASPNVSSQRIALYGLGHPATVAPTTQVTSTAFVNPSNGLAFGGGSATAALKTTAPAVPTATETVQTFTPAIPPGSTINRAVLRIRHYETDANPTSVAPKVVVTAPTGTVLTANPAVCTITCDWQSTDLSATLNAPAMIAGATVAYSATISGSNVSATENLDGIVLDVEYTPAGFAGETTANCTTTCPLIWGISSGATVVVSGTVYAPLASIVTGASNTTGYAFDGGVILRSLIVAFTNSVSQSAAVYVAPIIASAPGIRKVLFTVGIGGVTKLTAVVWFDDSVSVGGTVTVKSWSLDR